MTERKQGISDLTEQQKEELVDRLGTLGLRSDFIENLLDGVYGDDIEFATKSALHRQARRDRKRQYRAD